MKFLKLMQSWSKWFQVTFTNNHNAFAKNARKPMWNISICKQMLCSRQSSTLLGILHSNPNRTRFENSSDHAKPLSGYFLFNACVNCLSTHLNLLFHIFCRLSSIRLSNAVIFFHFIDFYYDFYLKCWQYTSIDLKKCNSYLYKTFKIEKMENNQW